MSSMAFAVIVFFVVVALFVTRRKGNGRHGENHNGYRGPRHGAFKDFIREKEKDCDYRVAGRDDVQKGGSVDLCDVRYREESKPFCTSDCVVQEDANLSGDTRGVYGESATSAIVARVAHDSCRHHSILQNVYIPTRVGYTEIDTVLLHETGIYVFETKNVSGEVIGDLEQERWNLHLNKRTHHTLYNPLKQNQGHIGALLRQLRISYSRARVYSFVVFSDRCVLRYVPASGPHFQVVHLGELRQSLAKVLEHSARVHDKRQIDAWKNALWPCVNVDESVKISHRESVKRLHG